MDFSAKRYYYSYLIIIIIIRSHMSPRGPIFPSILNPPPLIKLWRCRTEEAETGAIGPTRDMHLMGNSTMIIGDVLGYRDELCDINEYGSLLTFFICCSLLSFLEPTSHLPNLY